jgi:hypothetical protein
MKTDAKNVDRSTLIKELKKRLLKKWENDKLHNEAALLNEKISPLNKSKARTNR